MIIVCERLYDTRKQAADQGKRRLVQQQGADMVRSELDQQRGRKSSVGQQGWQQVLRERLVTIGGQDAHVQDVPHWRCCQWQPA